MHCDHPGRESARLAELRRCDLLDTPDEPAFERVVQLAADLLDAPIALLSLVDEDRQWFLARHGLDAEETPREHSFCRFAIENHSTLVVEDAALDGRFFDNPLVTGSPGVRFYAGAPLALPSGHRLGTLCVIDDHPRTLDSGDRRQLERVRDMAVDLIEFRRRSLAAQERPLPVCNFCARVRDEDSDDREWMPLGEYTAQRLRVFHTVCAACARHALELPPGFERV